MSRTRIAVLGATGRMGAGLVRELADHPTAMLAGAYARGRAGTDAGTAAGLAAPLGVPLTEDRSAALATAEVALDFTLPEALPENLAACLARGCALLVGTTGLDAAAQATLEAAGRRIAVLLAPNTSLGVALLARLVAEAARALPEDFDIEVLEAHHRDKRDAPSGTARLLAAAAAAARGRPRPEAAASRAGARAAGSIGFASLRGGDVAGEHTVLFLGPGERLELGHRTDDRRIFVRGALRAAEWLRGRAPGLYRMADVLGTG